MSSSADTFFRFCPHCGRRYHGRQRPGVLACSTCGFQFYQNSKPTASVFFEDGQGRILLVRRAVNPKKGWWDSPGGFLENGEDPLRGLRREMREELGVPVMKPRFLGIYMDTYVHGYRASTLNIIYVARIGRGTLKPMDDVDECRWFIARQIPWRRLAFRWLTPALQDWMASRK